MRSEAELVIGMQTVVIDFAAAAVLPATPEDFAGPMKPVLQVANGI